jgi:hypothetical protein
MVETLSDYLNVEKLKGKPNRTGIKRLSGKLWPTGEFSYGSYRERPDEKLDDREVTCWGGSESPPLDLTNLPNSRMAPRCLLSAGSEGAKPEKTTRKKYGRKGITGYGRKMLKSAGKLLQERPQHYRLTFCTITLPDLPDTARRAVSEGWGKMLNRLLEFLYRRLDRQSLPKAILCATEVQPKRLERTGQAYLHLHLIWPNHQNERRGWAIAPNDIREWMTSYLETHYSLSDLGHINIDTQRVTKAAEGYIAKYISKGPEEVEAAIEDIGEAGIPGQWWSMTKLLKEWVWLATEAGEAVGERLAQWVNWAFDYDNFELFRYLYHVEVPINGLPVTVGWRGAMTPEAMALWDEIGLKSHQMNP